VGHWGRYTEKVTTVNLTDDTQFSQKFCIKRLAGRKTVV